MGKRGGSREKGCEIKVLILLSCLKELSIPNTHREFVCFGIGQTYLYIL